MAHGSPIPANGLTAFAVLAGIALLGNGLKAFVTSTVLVGEARFAAFLGIPVERVALLMQTIVAGMVLALAVYPLLLRRHSVRAIALAACVTASAAFALLAAALLAQPPHATREFAAYAGLTLGAAALACLAPAAQALLVRWPAPAGRKVLTTLWTAATPAGFLAAPQLAKLVLPVAGLGVYFAIFAAMPVVLLALVLAATALPAMRDDNTRDAALPVPLLVAFVAVVLAFEAWSTVGALRGYAAPLSLTVLPMLVATVAWLVRQWRVAGGLPGGKTVLVAVLFLLQLPTTGFFEASFLFARGMPEALVADRATLAATAQVAGTLGTGLVVQYLPDTRSRLPMLFAIVAAAGVASYVAYPFVDTQVYFLATAIVTGLGAGGLTLLLCMDIVHDAGRAALVAALPAIAIMLGTEAGLELLQLAYAAAQSAGLAGTTPYGALFALQAVLALALLPAVAFARTNSAQGSGNAQA